jgi:hypothetical protein
LGLTTTVNVKVRCASLEPMVLKERRKIFLRSRTTGYQE